MLDILFDPKKNRHAHNIICEKCKNDSFKIIERFGGGGSGTYFKFECLECGNNQYIDFDNPTYEG